MAYIDNMAEGRNSYYDWDYLVYDVRDLIRAVVEMIKLANGLLVIFMILAVMYIIKMGWPFVQAVYEKCCGKKKSISE